MKLVFKTKCKVAFDQMIQNLENMYADLGKHTYEIHLARAKGFASIKRLHRKTFCIWFESLSTEQSVRWLEDQMEVMMEKLEELDRREEELLAKKHDYEISRIRKRARFK